MLKSICDVRVEDIAKRVEKHTTERVEGILHTYRGQVIGRHTKLCLLLGFCYFAQVFVFKTSSPSGELHERENRYTHQFSFYNRIPPD